MPFVDADLRSSLAGAIDDVFADRLILRAWKGKEEDPTRPPVEIYAPLRTQDEGTESLAGNRSQAWKGQTRAGGAWLRVNLDQYPDLDIRPGDEVQAPDRPGSPCFEVLSADTRSHLRIFVELGDK